MAEWLYNYDKKDEKIDKKKYWFCFVFSAICLKQHVSVTEIKFAENYNK